MDYGTFKRTQFSVVIWINVGQRATIHKVYHRVQRAMENKSVVWDWANGVGWDTPNRIVCGRVSQCTSKHC